MALLEVFIGSHGNRKVDLDDLPAGQTGFADFIVGRSPEVWLSLPDDQNVSRLHAKLSPIAGRWALEDLGARNGTWVNGERLVGMHVLHHGDEIRVGSTRVLFRDPSLDTASTTTPKGQRPRITDREQEVLVELCLPIFSANLVKKAASRKQIAGARSSSVTWPRQAHLDKPLPKVPHRGRVPRQAGHARHRRHRGRHHYPARRRPRR